MDVVCVVASENELQYWIEGCGVSEFGDPKNGVVCWVRDRDVGWGEGLV